jgi:hypothetical protein
MREESRIDAVTLLNLPSVGTGFKSLEEPVCLREPVFDFAPLFRVLGVLPTEGFFIGVRS